MKKILLLIATATLLISCQKTTTESTISDTDLSYKATGTITFVNNLNSQAKTLSVDSVHLYQQNNRNLIDISFPSSWNGDTTMKPLSIQLNKDINIFGSLTDSFRTKSVLSLVDLSSCVAVNTVFTSTSYLTGQVSEYPKKNLYLSTNERKLTLYGGYTMTSSTTRYYTINVNINW